MDVSHGNHPADLVFTAASAKPSILERGSPTPGHFCPCSNVSVLAPQIGKLKSQEPCPHHSVLQTGPPGSVFFFPQRFGFSAPADISIRMQGNLGRCQTGDRHLEDV